MKLAIVMYGPPGSGKGTQANLLADEFELIHFDTGKFLESVVHDPARQKEAIVRRERELFDTGILMTPSFVVGEILKEARSVAKAKWGLVFSGSPRTMYEATRLVPLLERLFGKKRVLFFELKVPAEASITRNSARQICTVCKSILLTAYHPTKHPKHCPVCAGPLRKRTLDNRETIKVRLKEYRNRTVPIFKFVKERGHRVIAIDGTPAPYKVFRAVSAHVRHAIRS